MTKTSLEALEELVKKLAAPSEPSNELVTLQESGNDPKTKVGDLSIDELTGALGYRKEMASVVAAEDENARQRIYDKWRGNLIPKVGLLVIVWLLFVMTTIVLAGANVLNLSDTVLAALIGTTTVTIIGLFALVLKWLFPVQPK